MRAIHPVPVNKRELLAVKIMHKALSKAAKRCFKVGKDLEVDWAEDVGVALQDIADVFHARYLAK